MAPTRIALIGFGEVGSIFARDLRAAGHSRITAFDIALPHAASKAARNVRQQEVTTAASAAEAVAGAELVICAVTAGSALTAARSARRGWAMRPSSWT